MQKYVRGVWYNYFIGNMDSRSNLHFMCSTFLNQCALMSWIGAFLLFHWLAFLPFRNCTLLSFPEVSPFFRMTWISLFWKLCPHLFPKFFFFSWWQLFLHYYALCFFFRLTDVCCFVSFSWIFGSCLICSWIPFRVKNKWVQNSLGPTFPPCTSTMCKS